MPVGYSSPARNFFLLGASGDDTITNFFRGVDKSADTVFNSFNTTDVQYNGATGLVQEYGISGWKHDSTSAAQAKEHGWIENRTLNLETLATSTIFDVTISSTIQSNARVNDILFANGFIYACGFADDNDFIAKYDESSGQIVGFSTSVLGNNRHFKLAVDANGEIYACGYIETSQNQITVVKYDANLNPVWSKLMDAYGQSALKSIAVAKDGNIVCVGYIGDQAHHDDSNKIKGYVVKVSSFTGEVLWDRTIEDNIGKGEYDFPCNIIIEDLTFNDSGEMFIVGYKSRYSINSESKDSGFIIKYDDVGNILWQSTSSYDNVALHSSLHYYRVKTDSDTGQTITLGRLINFDSAPGQNNAAVLLSKYSSSGELLWRREIDSSAANETYDGISLDADSTFYYVAFTDTSESLTNSRPDRYVFGKVSTSGNGLGAFQYDDQEGVNLDYVYNGYSDVLGRLSDGSVRNDTSDLITYPFNANKIVFDDLATHLTNKKAQINTAGNFFKSDFVEIRPADFPEINLLPGNSLDTGTGRILLVDTRGDQHGFEGVWRNLAGTPNYSWSLTNVTWDYNSGSYFFDDASPSTASLDIQNLLPTADTTPFTLEVWAMRHDSNRWQTVVSIANSWNQIAFDSANRISCGRNGGAGGINARSGVTSEANRWYHIVMSYDGNQSGSTALIDIYVDGVKTKSKIDMGVNTFGGNGTNLYLGRYAGGNGELLDGQIGEVRLYNKALNDVEVAQNYNASKGRFTGEEQFGKVLTNDVDVSWVDSSMNGYKAFTNLDQPQFNAVDGSWEFDGDGSTTFDQLNIDIDEFTPYGWEMWFENYNAIPANEGSIGGPSEYQVLASWMYPAGITLGGWTSSATNEAIIFWSKDQQNGANRGTYTRTAIPTGKHHLFVRWDSSASQYRIYVDGVEHTTYPIDGLTANHAQLETYVGKMIHIGGNNSVYYFHGKIFETRLYTREVTEAQVFQNYNATRYMYDGIATNTSPLIGPGILYDDLMINFDFGNDYTIERLGTIQG